MSGKKLHKLLLIFIVLIIVMGLTNCQMVMEILGMAETRLLRIVFLEPEAKTMPLGTQARYDIRGIYSDSHGDEETYEIEEGVVWSSSNESVCTVSVNDSGDDFYVYALGEGTAVITASKDSKSGTLDVEVVDPIVEGFMVSSGASTDTNFEVGATQQFTASANGNGGDIPESFDITPYVIWDVPWVSLDPEAATVDENGLVTFKETGSVAIRATLPEAIQADPLAATTSSANIEVIRSVSVTLDLTGTPDDAPLILSALYGENGNLAAMFPEGTAFSNGSLSLSMLQHSGDLYYPIYYSSIASVLSGTYSLHVVADMNNDTYIDTGDLGAIVSVSALYGEPAVVDATVSTPLIEQTVSISDAGSKVDDGAPITVFWLVEGDPANAMSYSSAEDVIPYLVTGENKNYPYPQGLREFSTGYFDADGNVTTMSSVLIPGTYDIVILIDGDVSGSIGPNSKDYFFFVEAKTVSGGNLDISSEFEGISIFQ